MNQANQRIWQEETELGKILTFQRGFDITKSQFKDGQYPVVFSSGIGGTHNEFKVKGPGVVIGRKGSLGTTFYIEKDFWPTDTTLWIKDFHGNDEKFAYYFLQALHLEKYDCGSSNPTLNRNHIHTILVNYPHLPIQRKIADILSAYDELIENNTRQIKILEEMAALIYREWFVNFRFPGHKQVKMVDSQLGLIPEGWEIKPLSDLTSVITKGTTPTTLGKSFVTEGINFLKVESIDSTGGIIEAKLAKIDIETHELLKRSQLKEGDILFSIADAIGRVCFISKRFLPANTNQALAIIRSPNKIKTLYLYQVIRSDKFINFNLGQVVQTAQANVSLSSLSSTPIFCPDFHTLEAFYEVIRPVMTEVDLLQAENINLRQTRDLLLPKLISGEIDLETLKSPEVKLWAA